VGYLTKKTYSPLCVENLFSIIFSVLIIKINFFKKIGSLINYWPMNNLTDVISGANLFGGSSYSFVPDRFCSLNSAIYFNHGYLQVPAGVYFSGDFTVTGWIYLKSYQYYSRIIDFGIENNNNNIILAFSDNTSMIYGKIVQYFQTSSIINLNKWYFIAYVLSGTTGYIYVNGNRKATGTLLSPNNITRKNNYIGKSNYFDQANADAIYDDIKIFKGALSSNVILNEYSTSSNNGIFNLRYKFE